MRAGNGAGTGSVMVFAMITTADLSGALSAGVSVGWMTPVDPVVAGIAASGSRVDDGVVVAVGRVRTCRIHRRTS